MSVLRAAQTRSLCLSACRTRNWPRPGLHLFWRNAQSRSYAGKPSGRTEPSNLKLGSIQENLNLELSRRYIKNLNPHTIHPDDYMDTSSRGRMPYVFFQEDTGENKPFKLSPYQIRGNGRFPKDCRGFLYYYQDPLGRPAVSGLRFRLAEEPTQTGFDNGKDFQPDGFSEPWSYSLLRLAITCKPGVDNILERLYKDGLVNPADVAKWSNIVNSSELFVDGRYPKRLMTSLDHPFEVELSDNAQRFYLVDPDQSRLLTFTICPVMETRQRWRSRRPYKGRCVIRLEKGEETETSDTNNHYHFKVFVLQVLTPIQSNIPGYDGGIELPTEGAYICRNGEPLTRRITLDTCESLRKLGNSHSTTSAPLYGEPGRTIHTLNPGKISSKDYLDFSQGPKDSLWTSANGAMAVRRGQKETTLVSNRLSLLRTTFDNDLLSKRGFLYYHQEAAHASLSGGLRFRLADGPSAAAFRRGVDLRTPQLDMPWKFPLLRIVKNKDLAPLLAQLVQDGLVTDDTISNCRRLIESSQRLPIRTKSRSQTIYSLDQPFMVDFNVKNRYIYVLDAEECRIWWMQALKYNGYYPFVGKCLVRCEELEVIPSSPNEPNPSHRTVQFRVVKILEPFRWRDPDEPHNRWELPRENALITKRGVPAEGHLYDQTRTVTVDAETDGESNDLA